MSAPLSPALGHRAPSLSAGRIAPLDTLPLFFALAGRTVVIAGHGDPALWKAELLHAAGARLLIFAGDEVGAERFAALGAGAQPVIVERRRWTPLDLAGAALAVGEPDDGAEFAAAARAAGVPVNIIDRPELSDFSFGTIVNRSPIVIGISTAGAAPSLGQSIRARIETMLPAGLTQWAAAARGWRPRIKAEVADFNTRRSLWQAFARLAWANADRPPVEADFRSLITREASGGARGRVIIAGAGPGDPRLVTIAVAQALQVATVVLHDDLVGAEVLDLARREARRISVGKRGGGPSCRQDEVNTLMVELALAGETVVRLKGGDPLIFGRLAEELEACRLAGIEVEVLAGISAAQGAAAALGLSLTERRSARRVQFITGHGSDGALPADISWPAITDPRATTLLYMPRRTLGQFVAQALAAGLDPQTPAVAITSATLPSQASVAAPLDLLAERAAALAGDAPMLVIIGAVAAQQLAEARTAGLCKTLQSNDCVG